MPIKSSNKGADFDELEEGTYPARIVGAVITGEEENMLEPGKTSIRMIITFEIPSETITIDGEERPRHITAFLAASSNPKSTLMKMINCLGDQIPDDLLVESGNNIEINDISGLIGHGLTISVEHNKKGRANVKGYAKLRSKELEKLEDLDNTPYAFDPYLEEPELEGTLDDVPNWVVKKVAKALDIDDFPQSVVDMLEERLEAIENASDEGEEEEKPAKKSKKSESKKPAKGKKKPKPEPEPEEDDEDEDEDWDDED